MKKWEWPLLVGFCAMLLWSAFAYPPVPRWWTTVFSPLCGDLFSSGTGGEMILRSKLAELIFS